jgi:hypothetical protein
MVFSTIDEFTKWFQEQDCFWGLSVKQNNNLSCIEFKQIELLTRDCDIKRYKSLGPPLYHFGVHKKTSWAWRFWLLGYSYDEYKNSSYGKKH